MDTPYLMVLLAISLYFVLLYHYQVALSTQSSVHCDPLKNLCVVCPHYLIYSKTHTFDQYLQLSSPNEFYVLGAFDSIINRNECREMLQLFEKGDKGEWKFPDPTVKDIEERRSYVASALQVNMAHGVQYRMTISKTTDFIMFYEGLDPVYPSISHERQSNPQNLLKISRSINWGMLFALLLTCLDRRLGLIGQKKEYPFPIIELIILCFVLYISYDVDSYAHLFIAEITCITYILFKVYGTFDEHKKSALVAGFLSIVALCLAGEEFTVVADLIALICIKKKIPMIRQSSARIKAVTALLVLCLIANTLRAIGRLNFLIYSSYAARTVMIPLTFLLFQQNQTSEETKTKLFVAAGKYQRHH